MDAAQNTQVVQKAYAAFGRGDIPAVLELLDEKVIWHPVTGAGPQVPTAGVRHGKREVGEFFRILGESINFQQFEPRRYVAEDDTVVALGHYRATTTGGGSFDSDWVMVFTVRNAKVVNFQEFTDSAALNAAFERQPA
jgi:ketosteroid isomerase-like protein